MVCLVGRQHPGRLIEDQDVGVPVKRLQDLHPLLVAHRKLFDHLVGIDVQLVFLRQFAQHLARLDERRAQKRAVLGAENDVLQHREILHQLEVLEDHADAGADRGLAVGDLDPLAVDEDLARIGLVESVEDRHQRRLAGTVLADDAVDRALRHLDRNVLVGLDGAEGFRNSAKLDGEGGGRFRPPRIPAARHQNDADGQVLSVM